MVRRRLQVPDRRDVAVFRVESVWQDLRFALRQLRANPGFASTAILALAMGIAAGESIFAFLDAALLQPLPYKDASRLVVAYETTDSCRECGLSYPDYQDWKNANAVFSSFEVRDASVYLWRSPEGVQAVRSSHVSGGFFRGLGVTAMLGRVFADADASPAAPRAVVLTYGAWQSRFGGRRDIVGQSLILDNAPQVDPNLGVRNEFVMDDRINDSPAAFLNRSSAWLVGAFAASALLLGAIGLYGVIAYSVGQRTREIGVRMALGAQRGTVYRLILGQAGFLAAVGIAVGLGRSTLAARLLRGLLFGVQSWDAPTFIGVAVALGICALLASYLPARRAASVNPVEALRAE